MKKILIILVGILLFNSCQTPDERIAISFLKSKLKAPSTFKLLNIESEIYDWQSEDIEYDTIFFNSKRKVNYYYPYYDFETTELESGYSQNYFNESKRMKINQKYDSIIVIKRWNEISPATWVTITYRSNNLFNVPLEDTEIIVVRNKRARFLIDDIDINIRYDTILVKKFDKLQVYR
jgi:hypothetical protein